MCCPTWSAHVYTPMCASPCVDPTLNINNLCLVAASVENWYDLGYYNGGLDIPTSVLDEIRGSTIYKTKEEKKEALLLYYLRYIPIASWSCFAGALHYREEKTALQVVKNFLDTPAG